jgi:hypothetical protein
MEFIKNNKKIILISLAGLVLVGCAILIIANLPKKMSTNRDAIVDIDQTVLDRKTEKYLKIKDLQDKITEASNSSDPAEQQKAVEYRKQLDVLKKSTD